MDGWMDGEERLAEEEGEKGGGGGGGSVKSGCPVTRCLCNQNKASPLRHLSHWSRGGEGGVKCHSSDCLRWLVFVLMWNFLFLGFSFFYPHLSATEQKRGEEEEVEEGGLCSSGLFFFPNIGTCFVYPLITPLSHPPPYPPPNLGDLTPILPGMHLLSRFPFCKKKKDGDQRASIVYCSSVMVWKQPSAEGL